MTDELTDAGRVREALRIGRSHLPLFAADRRTVERAQAHLVALDEGEAAFDSLLARLSAAETEMGEARVLAAAERKRATTAETACRNEALRADELRKAWRANVDDLTATYSEICQAAEARVEALSEALREIARREYIGETTAGLRIDSAVHGREGANAIARAALACPPQQRGE